MLKTFLNVLLVSLLVVAVSGCSAIGVPTVDPNAVGTAIAQTLAAFSPTSSPVSTATSTESPTPTLTMTTVATVETLSPTWTVTSSATSSSTAVPSLTMTPLTLSTATAALSPGVVQVSVSVSTNCRVGPGIAYTRVGLLQVGETAEVVGRYSTDDYWIIRTPGSPSSTCWLWGQYATVSGNTSALPVFTPPAPPPTTTAVPGFDVAYEGMESCSSTGWWVDLGLENIGTTTFRSVTFTIEDRDTDETLTQRANGFINKNGCSETATSDTLAPDVSRTVSSPVLEENPTGHRLRATITLCSETGQNGTCMTQTVNMTP